MMSRACALPGKTLEVRRHREAFQRFFRQIAAKHPHPFQKTILRCRNAFEAVAAEVIDPNNPPADFFGSLQPDKVANKPDRLGWGGVRSTPRRTAACYGVAMLNQKYWFRWDEVALNSTNFAGLPVIFPPVLTAYKKNRLVRPGQGSSSEERLR